MIIVPQVLSFFLFTYLVLTIPYLFLLAAAGRFGRLKSWTQHPLKARIAVIIPSYKDDSVILDTAEQAVLQDYQAFQVTVIADCLQPETIARLRKMPINLIEVNWEKSMKAKSLDAAFSQLPAEQYDIAFILDADNLMSPGCLQKVNHAYQSGWKAIQCHRTAKNKNNSFAILDAISEEINNTIFRRGQRVLGLSCALIGSGMAFEFGLIKNIFASPGIQNNPGEDKEVEVELIKKCIPVEYLELAYVYDEKVQRKEVFEKQRTRWLATQMENIKLLLAGDMRHLLRRRNYLHKIFEWILLPRLLLMALLALLLACCVIDARTGVHFLSPPWPWWMAIAVLYGLTLLIATPATFFNKTTVKALLKMPVLLFSMLKALAAVKKNKAGFIHTPKEFSR